MNRSSLFARWAQDRSGTELTVMRKANCVSGKLSALNSEPALQALGNRVRLYKNAVAGPRLVQAGPLMLRLQLVEDEIGRKLAEAEKSGELASAEGFGKPIQDDCGWTRTPVAHRMAMKILKDAGVVPHEVEMLNERARLRAHLDAAMDPAQRDSLAKKLSTLEQSISLRLEALNRRS